MASWSSSGTFSGEGEEHLVEVGLSHRDVVELDARCVERLQCGHLSVAGGVDAYAHPSRGLVDLRDTFAEATEQLGDGRHILAVADVHLDDVAADPLLELGRSTGGDGPTVVDDDDLAGEMVGLIEVLGGQQHVGPVLHERPDRRPQLDPAPRIQAGGGLVEQQQPRSADETRTEVKPPAHPPGIGASQPVTGLDETELLEHGASACLRRAPAQTEQAGDHLEVLTPGHRGLDGGELARQADHAADRGWVLAGIVACDEKRALVGSQERRHHPHERRLASAVGAEHRRHLPAPSEQLKAVQRLGLSILLGEAVSLDRGSHLAVLRFIMVIGGGECGCDLMQPLLGPGQAPFA